VSEWIEHNGGPQPVADDVWVAVLVTKGLHFDVSVPTDGIAPFMDWPNVSDFRILNQHLIDAARLDGIRLGLEAAARAVDFNYENSEFHTRGDDIRALEADIQANIAREAKPPA